MCWFVLPSFLPLFSLSLSFDCYFDVILGKLFLLPSPFIGDDAAVTTPAHRATARGEPLTSLWWGLAIGRPSSAWGPLPVASASGPRGEVGQEHHLVVVKVPVDGEAMSPDPLGLARRTRPGPPLNHAGCVTLGPHQLGGLLVLLQGLCSEERVRRSVRGGAQGPENC